MARLYVHQVLPEETAILTEAEIAIRTTAATLEDTPSQVNGNYSLCHGDGGNADLLMLADDLLDWPELRQQAEGAGIRALEKFERPRAPWPCGIRREGETPNLLLGLAGIGYFFLRLYDSKTIPTVLLPGWKPVKSVTAGAQGP
jgi:lantibiotic modifying enzyme